MAAAFRRLTESRRRRRASCEMSGAPGVLNNPLGVFDNPLGGGAPAGVAGVPAPVGVVTLVRAPLLVLAAAAHSGFVVCFV
eukprot:scaffold47175_cov24-Cyclotella_meneghiniana.AAC.1